MKLYNLILNLSKMSVKADRIKSDPVKRSRSCYFALSSMFTVVGAVGFVLLGLFIFSLIGSDTLGISLSIFLAIPIIIIGIFFCLAGAACILNSAVMLIFQFTINRSAWSWIALVFFLAALAGGAFTAYYLSGVWGWI